MSSYVCITAAAGGLGKAFAAECAARGWDLVLTDIRADLLNPLAAGLRREFKVEVITIPCDLSDPLSRDALWDELDRRGAAFHFLINIAGTEFQGPFAERSVAELRALLSLNISAAVEMTSQVLRRRDPARPLHIINTSSLAGFYPMPEKAVYAASKRFLIDFSRALNQELRSEGVTVTALCPAGLPTNPRSIRGIVDQGLMGQLTMQNVGDAAHAAVEAALKGRAVFVPGFINNFLRRLGSLLPSSLKATFIHRRWKKARLKRSLNQPPVQPA